MLRVLHIFDHGLPLQSGYAFRSRAILKAQEALGITVAGITGPRQGDAGSPAGDDAESDADEAIEDGLTFFRTVARPQGPPVIREWREIQLLADRIEEVAAGWRPDLIHAHSPALCGLAALRAARALRLPLVYEIRAFWEDAAVGNGTGREGSARYWLTRQLENRVIAGADHVVTICRGLREDLGQRGFDADCISVVPNGVDMGLFGTIPRRDPVLAEELRVQPGLTLGYIGSFYDYEGLDLLVDAMPAIVARHPRTRLLLVGGGPVLERVRRRAEASPVTGSIHFAGRVPHDEVERYYGLMDVMVYPRRRMRLTELVTPLKPLEAMAQCRLVVASDVGGHRELVEDGVTGTLFAAGDPMALAGAVNQLLADRTGWEHRRSHAREHVARDHDWADNAGRYLPVYQKLTNSAAMSAIDWAA